MKIAAISTAASKASAGASSRTYSLTDCLDGPVVLRHDGAKGPCRSRSTIVRSTAIEQRAAGTVDSRLYVSSPPSPAAGGRASVASHSERERVERAGGDVLDLPIVARQRHCRSADR